MSFPYWFYSCIGQEENSVINENNFEEKIKTFDFSNINIVSEKDFHSANHTLKQIELNLYSKGGKYTTATYWNYSQAFYKLGIKT